MNKHQSKYFGIKQNLPDRLGLYYSKTLELYEPVDMAIMQEIAEKEGFIVNANDKVTTINKEKMKIFSRAIVYVIAKIDPSKQKVTLFSPEIIPAILKYGEEILGWDQTDKEVTKYLKFPYLEFLENPYSNYLLSY